MGKKLFLLWLAAMPLLGCSVRTAALRTTAGLLDRGSLAFYQESDPKLARDAMPAQLKLMEALLESDPANRDLLKSLAEGFAGYAFLFLEDEEPERARAFYRRAADYGLSLAKCHAALKDLERMPAERLGEALRSAGPKDVPALYWTAMGMAGWANLSKGDPDALADLPRAARMMDRVMELDPGYQHGGADLFLGIYYSARPKIAGGDPEKGKAHFEAALKRGERRFLMAQLLYAKYYAVAVSDSQLFRRLNEETLQSRADLLPDARLANEVAKLKAKNLLEKIDELF